MDMQDITEKIDRLLQNRSTTTETFPSSKSKVLEFCAKNGINPAHSSLGMRAFPRSAYADELERYPVLKDNDVE